MREKAAPGIGPDGNSIGTALKNSSPPETGGCCVTAYV